jgi:hypothetical protein
MPTKTPHPPLIDADTEPASSDWAIRTRTDHQSWCGKELIAGVRWRGVRFPPCAGASSVFAVHANGQLLDYRNATVSTPTAAGAGGRGFVGRTLAGPGSTIYFIGSDGDLRLYHYQNGQWAAGSGAVIGNGFPSVGGMSGLCTYANGTGSPH